MSDKVDEVWQKLKAGQAPRSVSSRRAPTLSGFGGIPGVSSTVRTYDKSRGPPQPAARPSFIAQLSEGPRSEEKQAQAGPDHQALLASLQRDINGLSDPDRTVRRRAVEKLHSTLLSNSVASSALQAAVAGPLLVPLVRLLADPAEKCRELAVGFLAAALPRLPQPAALLSTLVPALHDRVGSLPAQEGSEEIRLALAELVAGPLLGHAPQPLPADLLPGLCATVYCQLQDAYADIKKEACTAVAALVGLAAPAGLPSSLQQPLVAVLANNLAHQHSRVRLASLQALHALVQQGMPLALMQEHVLPAVRPLAHDHATGVRAALFSCSAQWAGSRLAAGAGDAAGDDGRAANQCRAFLPLLLPLVLLGLTDEAEAIRSDTYSQLQAIGEILTSQAGSPADRELPNSMALDQPQQLPGYCHPFTAGRPSLATRWLVQSQLTRLLQQCLADLREWTATLRASAARLLRAALIYGEAEVLSQLPTVVLALRTAVADDDAGVATHAIGCVHALGVNLPARHWMPLAAEAVAAEQHTVAQRTAALVVLSGLLYGAAKSGSAEDSNCLQLAATTLCSAHLGAAAAAADGAALRQQLLAACSNLLQWAGPASAGIGAQLFQLLLQLWAVEADSGAEASAAAAAEKSGAPDSASLTAAGVLAQLAAALGSASPADLCDQYGPAMLQSCLQGHEQWTHAHAGWRSLSALLRLCNSQALLQLWPAALPALQQVAADHERDPRLRLELLHLAAALLADDSKAGAWQQAGAGQLLVRSVLLPALVWRAGRVPAAVRYAALTALVTLLSCQRLPAAQLAQLGCEGAAEGSKAGSQQATAGSLLGQVAGCMDEDYEPDTRQLACHTLQLLLASVGQQLPGPQLAALQPDLLKRLDDSSNRVRVAACAALQPWVLAAAEGLPEGNAAALASSLLLHMDDPDDDVAEAVCAVLEQLAAARPAMVRPLAQAAAAQHTRRSLLDRVLAACGAPA